MTYFRNASRLILCACLLGLLSAGALRSIRLARAQALSESGSADSLRSAEQILPGCARYPKARGLLLSQEMENPDEAADLFRRALSLNPRDASLWIELGLQDEVAENFALAEEKFLKAASLDNMFPPRWSLANFYFRRNETEKFLIWAKRSAEMAHGNLTPLFKLSLRITGSPSTVLNRVIAARPEILGPYLQFMLDENRVSDAIPVAQALSRTSHAKYADQLMAFCDRLLAEYPKNRELLEPAIELWNSMVDRKIILLRRIDRASGNALINADFLDPPRSHGFDWRVVSLPAVQSSFSSPESSVSFSGKQPEICDILYQLVPVDDHTNYQFSVNYKTADIGAPSGLSWRLLNEADGSELGHTQYLHGAEWGDERVQIKTAGGIRLLRLVLSYRRVPGTMRTEGTLLFRNAGLQRTE